MDLTERLALGIVAVTAVILIFRLIKGKKNSSCCKQGCDLENLKNKREGA